MRVTHLGAHHAALNRLTTRLSEYSATQERLSTGRQMTRPSDDPIGMNRALQLRATLSAREQEGRNAADGQMWLDLADTKLQDVVTQIQRARELAVRGATYVGPEEREAIALEIGHLRDSIVAQANAQHQGRGLFSGFSSSDAVEKVGGVWTYTGDSGQINRRVGENEVVTINVTGDVAFGFSSGNDIFTVLDDLEAALYADDTAGIESGIGGLDTSLQTVLGGLGIVGAKTNQLESASLRTANEIQTITEQLATLEDVDIAEAVMELELQQTAYEAALAAFSRSAQTSLVDFLR
ncbi:MAG: flagellar hook-associated protein FlgL [Acidimicrobiia bacterium]|nr:flagellar hook-associated protein FlgL [Acidimicrobiia bacterium]MDJ0664288.1 flagellar hook-associated protein FlgL [Acidimicrobiia bacterium]